MVKSSDLQCSLEELSAKLRQSVKLDHLLALTDHIAVLQHSKFSVPARKEGYAVDDSARALVFAVKATHLWPDTRLPELPRKLVSFLLLMQAEDGRFHNLLDYSQRIIDEPTVGDHLGRAVWAAGVVMNSDLPEGVKASARLLFDKALPWVRQSTWPRTKAYGCLGIHERIRSDPENTNLRTNLKEVANSLVDLYQDNKTPGWNWFEEIITYDNARLSQALLAAYSSLRDNSYLTVAEDSLQFLLKANEVNSTFAPIGNMGWHVRGGDRALYDQQPIEAGSVVEATSLAYRLTGSELYERGMRSALGWFLGLNTKSVKLYDESTGACYDGINSTGLNQNQGAESTLAFLLAAEALVANSTQK